MVRPHQRNRTFPWKRKKHPDTKMISNKPAQHLKKSVSSDEHVAGYVWEKKGQGSRFVSLWNNYFNVLLISRLELRSVYLCSQIADKQTEQRLSAMYQSFAWLRADWSTLSRNCDCFFFFLLSLLSSLVSLCSLIVESYNSGKNTNILFAWNGSIFNPCGCLFAPITPSELTSTGNFRDVLTPLFKHDSLLSGLMLLNMMLCWML